MHRRLTLGRHVRLAAISALEYNIDEAHIVYTVVEANPGSVVFLNTNINV